MKAVREYKIYVLLGQFCQQQQKWQHVASLCFSLFTCFHLFNCFYHTFVHDKNHKLLLLNGKYIIYTLPHSPKLADLTIAKSTLAILHTFSHKLIVFIWHILPSKASKNLSDIYFIKT